MRLAGKTAVIVGVGSAIGRSCAMRFANEGAEVLAVDSSERLAQEVAAAISVGGRTAEAIAATPGTDEGAVKVATHSASLWGQVNTLVHCRAAVDDWEWNSPDDTIDKWERLIRITLLDAVAYTRAFTSLLRQSGSGSIVYLASIDGLMGNPTIPAYSVAKAGIIALTRVMAFSCGSQGIRVNCVATGAIRQDSIDVPEPVPTDPSWNTILQLTPLGRLATPDDVASTIHFLASSDAQYINGSVITLDGGRTAITPGTAMRESRPSA